MGRHLTWMITIATLGCGPSIELESDTDAADGTASGSAGDTDSASRTGGGPGSTRGGDTAAVTSDAGIDDGDDASVKLDVLSATTGDACIEWASMGCPLDVGPVSLVHGGTPLGELSGPNHAFFSGAPLCDWCVDAPRLGSIFFVTDAAVIEQLGPLGGAAWPGLELRLDQFEGPLDQELTVQAIMRSDGEEALGMAQIRIDTMPEPHELGEPFDASAPALISGEVIAIGGRGWSVHGTFVAAYCPQANEIWICE